MVILCFPVQTCLRGTNSARAPSRWLTWSGRRWENQRHWQTVDQNKPSVAGSDERDSPPFPVPWQKPRSPFPAKSRRRLQLWTHARAQGAQLADKRRGDNLLSQRLLFLSSLRSVLLLYTRREPLIGVWDREKMSLELCDSSYKYAYMFPDRHNYMFNLHSRI